MDYVPLGESFTLVSLNGLPVERKTWMADWGPDPHPNCVKNEVAACELVGEISSAHCGRGNVDDARVAMSKCNGASTMAL